MNLLLSDTQLVGFTRQEKRRIERYVEKLGITQYDYSVAQEIADLIERDVGMMYEPGGKIKLLGL